MDKKKYNKNNEKIRGKSFVHVEMKNCSPMRDLTLTVL